MASTPTPRATCEGDQVVITTGPIPIGLGSGQERTAFLQRRAQALRVWQDLGYRKCQTTRKPCTPQSMIITDLLKEGQAGTEQQAEPNRAGTE